MTTAYILLAVQLVLAAWLIYVANQLRKARRQYVELRNKNADLIDDNRAKAEALQKLVEAVESVFTYDLDYTLTIIDELSEKQFFEESMTLLDPDAIDRVTDWSNIEVLCKYLEAAKDAANT